MDISQIITPDDALKLESHQQYQFYFDLVQHAMNTVVEGAKRLHDDKISQQETEFIRLSAERILYTLKGLELRYLHIDENTMEIDVTESGYPNYSALRFLNNEIAFIEKEKNVKVDEVNNLVDGFVEKLMTKKERIGKEEISTAAFSLFHNTIEKQQLFNNFVWGAVRPSELKEYDYVAYWMNYDVLYNRPFVSVMYFDIDEEKNSGMQKFDEQAIIKVVKGTVPASTVQSVIYDIDKNLEELEPKLFKRIDLGPLFSIFSRDDKNISITLRNAIKEKNLPIDSFAVEIIIDQVKSTGILETGSRFSFIKKSTIQNWSEAERDGYLMAPHAVIQYLFNNNEALIKQLAKHPIDVEPIKKEEQ